MIMMMEIFSEIGGESGESGLSGEIGAEEPKRGGPPGPLF